MSLIKRLESHARETIFGLKTHNIKEDVKKFNLYNLKKREYQTKK